MIGSKRTNSSRRPGFRLARTSPTVDPDLRLADAAELVASVNAARAARGVALVGPLSVARTRYDEHAVHDLQLRSEPLADCSGGDFRFRVTAGYSRDNEEETICEVCEAERRFDGSRPEVARRVEIVRAMVAEQIARHGPADAPASILAIGCEPFVACPEPIVHVDLQALGKGLTLGVERTWGLSEEHLRHSLERALSLHAERAARLSVHRADRARRLMDETVPLVLASAGMDLDFALDRLERRRGFAFIFGKGRRMRGHLGWAEGRLEVEFRDLAHGIELSSGMLTVRDTALPHAIMSALPGRRLDALISHPCLPAAAPILGVLEPGRDAALRVRVSIDTVQLPTGT